MEKSRAGIVSGKASGGRDGHRIVESVEQTHAKDPEQACAHKREDKIDAPNPFSRRTETRVHLATQGSRSLGREHLNTTADERGYDGNREEDDTKASYPLRHRTPEEQCVRQSLDIVDKAGTRRSETRHGLEVGISRARQITTGYKGNGPEETEDDPREGDHKVGFAAIKSVVGIASSKLKEHGSDERNHYGKGERPTIVLVIEESHQHTPRQHHCLEEQKLTNNLIEEFPIDHRLQGINSLACLPVRCSIWSSNISR